MSAQPITTPVLLRPHYDNTRLGDFPRWLCDNTLTLGRFALQLGFDLTAHDEEFSRWIRCQYDIEVLISTADPSAGISAGGSKTTVETVRASLPHGDAL
jgi:hypothetical protein